MAISISFFAENIQKNIFPWLEAPRCVIFRSFFLPACKKKTAIQRREQRGREAAQLLAREADPDFRDGQGGIASLITAGFAGNMAAMRPWIVFQGTFNFRLTMMIAEFRCNDASDFVQGNMKNTQTEQSMDKRRNEALDFFQGNKKALEAANKEIKLLQ